MISWLPHGGRPNPQLCFETANTCPGFTIVVVLTLSGPYMVEISAGRVTYQKHTLEFGDFSSAFPEFRNLRSRILTQPACL